MKSFRFASLLLAVLVLGSMFKPASVHAGGCFEDPVYDYDWTGAVVSGVYVRSVACMDGSTILTTLSTGATVSVTGFTDGWYRVKLSNGTEGWVGEQFLSITQSHYTYPASSPTPTSQPTSLSSSAAAAVRARTVGYILLQVESHGEAWYVDPVTRARFYMKDGPTAYEMMRTFGLGMTEADYARLASGDRNLINSLKGRIVLRVQLHGEAYYIHPDGTVYYLADGPAAYSLMRLHSLGITNTDLTAITLDELELIPYSLNETAPVVLGTTDETQYDTVTDSQYQAGSLPTAFDAVTLNESWLEMLNAERVERGFAPVELDQRLVDSATDWSAYMGEHGSFSHLRPNGQSLLGWVEGFNYTFTDDGVTNKFGENLAFVYAVNTSAGMEKALQDAMDMFMAEEPVNGAHFQNNMNPDWNTTGAGFYLEKYDATNYQIYMTFHFASLEE